MIIRVETKLTLNVGSHYVHQAHTIELDHSDVEMMLADGKRLPEKVTRDVFLSDLERVYNSVAQTISDSVWDAIIDNLEELEGG